jgi:exopolysaccharide biosynthesis protein
MGIISINEKSGRTRIMKRAFVLAYVTIIFCSLLTVSAAEAIAASTSDSIITIKVSCTYTCKKISQTAYAEKMLTLIDPTPAGPGSGSSTVYLTGCWRRTVTPDGKATHVFDCPIATGWTVRAFVWVDGQKTLVDGIQADDGTVVVDGKSYQRVPGI